MTIVGTYQSSRSHGIVCVVKAYNFVSVMMTLVIVLIALANAFGIISSYLPGEIPANLGGLANLTTLDLRDNILSGNMK